MRRSLATMFAALLALGCNSPSTREGPVIEGSGSSAPAATGASLDWTYSDTERSTRALAKKLLASSFAERRLQIRLEAIANETAQAIDTTQIRDLLSQRLRRSGRFRILQGSDEPKLAEDLIRQEDSSLYAKPPPKTRVADYRLGGRLSVLRAADAADYRLELSLTRDGEEVWSAAEEIRKSSN